MAQTTPQGNLIFRLWVSQSEETAGSYLLPTPAAGQWQSRPPTLLCNGQGGRLRPGQKPYHAMTGQQAQTLLPQWVRLWPTPIVERAAWRGGDAAPPAPFAGRLNAEWVEALMGFPPDWTTTET